MVRVAVPVVLLLALAGAVLLSLRGGGAVGSGETGPIGIGSGDPTAPVPIDARQDPSIVRLPTGMEDLGPVVADLPYGTGVVGTVREPGGEPVAGAIVWLLRADRDARLGSAVTDPQGRFGLPLGFEDDRGLASVRVAAHHPTYGRAAPVEVRRPADGQTARTDLLLDEPGLAIAGVVRGPAGDPLPDYPVTLVRIDESPEVGPEWTAGRSDAEVRTDAAGRFGARGLRNGLYEIDYEPPDAPVGFDDVPPSLRIAVPAGAEGLDLRVPFARVEFDVVDDGRPRVADLIALRAFSEADADRIAGMRAAGESLDRVPTGAEVRNQASVERLIAFAAPGAFLVASASVGGRIAEVDHRVSFEPVVQRVSLRVGDGAGSVASVRLTVLRPDGARPARVLFRTFRPDGLPVAPGELPDLGGGWRDLPAEGALEIPSGPLRFELLGDPFDAGRAWFPTTMLSSTFDWNISPPPDRPERTIRLRPGAWIEIEVVQDAAVPTDAARAAWLAARLPGDQRVVKGYASIEPERGAETALRLAWIDADGTWTPVLGVPHRPGETVVLRALGAFEAGPCRFALQTWRPATIEDSAGWPMVLQEGRNLVRLRLDADAVLRWAGR